MTTSAPDAAAAAKETFLDDLRARVGRQADLADRIRQGLPLENLRTEPCAASPAADLRPETVHVAAAAQPSPVRAPAAPAAQPQDHWNIWTLEKLVRERGLSEESAFTLLHLRGHADARGNLPACFTPLADELVA